MTLFIAMSPVTSPRRPLHRLSTRLLTRVADALESLDEHFPLAPHYLAERLVDRHFSRSSSRAQKDPRWAAIESRRLIPGSTNKLMLSDDLTITDWIEQDRIAEELSPSPFWLDLARSATLWSLATPVKAHLSRRHRADSGWSESDVFNFDHYITRVIGEALATLAQTAHGWPSDRYETYDLWVKELSENSDKLLAFARRRGEDEATALWHTLAQDRRNQSRSDEAFRLAQELELANLKGAKQAMKWVAKNLGSLWD